LERIRKGRASDGSVEDLWCEVVQAATRESVCLLAELREAVGAATPPGSPLVDVNALVRRVAAIARGWIAEQAREGGVPFRIELDTLSEPLVVHGSTALVSAMAHAIASALQRLPEGGQVLVRTQQDRGDVVISVASSGAGLRDEHLDATFVPLEAGEGHYLRLGLSVVRSVAARHGGELRLEPRDDGGTALELRLPAHGTAPVVRGVAEGSS
jgi:signal transduction histidine kinase